MRDFGGSNLRLSANASNPGVGLIEMYGRGYRSEIDGLRAVAVTIVVFFHAGFELFRGGLGLMQV